MVVEPVAVDDVLGLVDARRHRGDRGTHAPLGALDQLPRRSTDRLGSVASREPKDLSRTDRERRDLRSEVADRLVWNPDVGLEQGEEHLVRNTFRDDSGRWDAEALLVDLGRVGPVARGRTTADVEMVTERAGDRDRLSVDENCGERLDVGQVLTARVRVVRRIDITLAPSVERESGQHRAQRPRHRVEVHRDPRRLRHDAAVDVEDRRRVVEHLADDLGVGRSLDRCRHLLGRRDEAVPDHLQGDRVDTVDRAVDDQVLLRPPSSGPARAESALHRSTLPQLSTEYSCPRSPDRAGNPERTSSTSGRTSAGCSPRPARTDASNSAVPEPRAGG